jgi:hypothetical protein
VFRQVSVDGGLDHQRPAHHKGEEEKDKVHRTAVTSCQGVQARLARQQRLLFLDLWKWSWDWEKDGSGAEFGEAEGKQSLITVEFLKRGERTEMVLTHSRFATVESRDNHARGWDKLLESFATFVEKE